MAAMQGFEYGRSGNPTRCGFETQVAAVEGAKFGTSVNDNQSTEPRRPVLAGKVLILNSLG